MYLEATQQNFLVVVCMCGGEWGGAEILDHSTPGIVGKSSGENGAAHSKEAMSLQPQVALYQVWQAASVLSTSPTHSGDQTRGKAILRNHSEAAPIKMLYCYGHSKTSEFAF